MSIPHMPTRPTWKCADDGEQWPCPPARERLLEEFCRDRVALHLYMAVQYLQAVDDMPADSTSGLLFGRFLGRWR